MDILSAIFRQQTRKIGVLVPSVIISEKHQDALEITEHPVEIGAAVNDHAYKRAAEVTMEVGFAGGGSLLDFADTTSIGLRLGKSPEEVYQELIALQDSREPIDVITGKRKYSNMLIRTIEVTTDKTTENVLMCVMTLREVIMTQTESVMVADKENMQDGVSTSAMQNTGTKAPAPTNTSVLKSGLDWIKGNLT
ncbi:phage baseplate protein [Yersinia kristensenii]|uniref:Dit-like phage tail protein N-terminal domain-containing protein n=1 Tax=Yersinia kristensenii TaxID=28152 RepID=A0A0T9KLU0_YERKR|nr:hypothetical protein [Yersinia kristensenii]CNE11672.1 Uncharacterised protein [Yersinia kristensenii]